MMKTHTLIISTLCACALLSACKEDDPTPKDEKEFADIFGSYDTQHTWNMAYDTFVTIDQEVPGTPQPVSVYARYFNRLYVLSASAQPQTSETLQFDIPYDVYDLEVLVGNRLYDCRPGDRIQAFGDGKLLADLSEYQAAEPLGWMIACELPDETDYDFNDLVARIAVNTDGSVTVTAMASGTERRAWIHFFDGTTDYVISPYAFNGYMEPITYIHRETAFRCQWHNWFSAPGETWGSGISINVLSVGGARKLGQSVTIPAKAFEGHRISAANLFDPQLIEQKKKPTYAFPKYGFYFSLDSYDVTKPSAMIDDNDDATPYDLTVCAWPAGNLPKVLVVPDASELDTPQKHTGWQWPSEMSRIDYVYPEFPYWVRQRYAQWSAYEPMGWTDRPGQLDEKGKQFYYGYYPR